MTDTTIKVEGMTPMGDYCLSSGRLNVYWAHGVGPRFVVRETVSEWGDRTATIGVLHEDGTYDDRRSLPGHITVYRSSHGYGGERTFRASVNGSSWETVVGRDNSAFIEAIKLAHLVAAAYDAADLPCPARRDD